MATYFIGSEIDDFVLGGVLTNIFMGTSASGYDSANSRGFVNIDGAAEDTAYIETTAFSDNEFWTHWVHGYTSILSSSSRGVKFYEGGTAKIAILFNQSADVMSVQLWNGSSWVTTLTSATGLFGALGRYKMDVFIKLGNPGRISVYRNGVPIMSDATLDLSAYTNIDKVRFGVSGSTVNNDLYWSEIIVADWNTIGSKVVTRIPDANGNYTTWTGAYTDIDDISGGVDVISSNNVGDRESWSLSNFPALAGGESIESVKMSVNAIRDAAGPQSLNMFNRQSTTDYDGSDKTLTTSNAGYNQVWDLNPATSAAWTITELNAAEWGVRART